MEYNNMCLLLEKEIVERDNTPWFNSEIARAIKHIKSKEKKWRNLKTVESRRESTHAKHEVNKLIRRRKCSYYRQTIANVGSEAKRLYSLLDSLTGNLKKQKRFPEGYTDTDFANEFVKYFNGKITQIVISFQGSGPLPQHRHMPDIPYIGLPNFREVDLNYLVIDEEEKDDFL